MNSLQFPHFRGWGEKFGRWVCGGYFTRQKEPYIAIDDTDAIPAMVRINPNSLGMFTGLYDRDRTPIYGAINGSRGGDILDVNDAIIVVKYHDGYFSTGPLSEYNKGRVRVIGNQWEQPELLEGEQG